MSEPNKDKEKELIKPLTADEFDQTLNKPGQVALVDFWAPWCGPCQAQLPLLEKLAEEVGDDYLLAKVDVDEEPELARRFQIRSIPTIAILREGQVVQVFTGVQQPRVLKSSLEKAATVSAS